jgi:hypothetical protein
MKMIASTVWFVTILLLLVSSCKILVLVLLFIWSRNFSFSVQGSLMVRCRVYNKSALKTALSCSNIRRLETNWLKVQFIIIRMYSRSQRFEASAAMLRSSLFWGITQRRVITLYRRFGTTYRSYHQGPRSQRREKKIS